MAKLKSAHDDPDAPVTAAGITFRKEGDLWCDTRLSDPSPSGTKTIHLRTYGTAYFRLAGADGRLAEWLGVGERIRLLLPGIVLEITPEGEDRLETETIRRILDAIERA